jgi:hypothetical protein
MLNQWLYVWGAMVAFKGFAMMQDNLGREMIQSQTSNDL